MFENAFNLKFNLHKAYTDIGIKDDDAVRLGYIYEIPQDEIGGVMEGFAAENRKNAAAVLAGYPEIRINKEKHVKIAYIGDSITSDRISHQRIMQTMLAPYPNIEIADFSISGWKVSDVYTAYYPGIANFAPDIAVVMIGTNDMRITNDEFRLHHTSLPEYERDLDYVVKKLTGDNCRVIICTLPPFCMEKMTIALPDWKILYTGKDRERYDAVIINIAEKYDCILADMREKYAVYDPAEITIEDGLHLNGAGQTMLAGEVLQKLFPLLEK
jgi:lysophospholipase L1-like esterase